MISNEQLAQELEGFSVYECVPGWDTICGYALMRGTIPYGSRRSPACEPKKVSRLIKDAETYVNAPLLKLCKPLANRDWGIAASIHPLDDKYGLSTNLRALADEMHGPGGWRIGTLPGSVTPVVIKARRGKLLAVIAPARWRP